MAYIGQIVFILLTAGAFYYAFKQFSRIKRNINLGQDEDISGDTGERIKNTLLIAFGQKKMFKRILPAFFHLAIYVAFLVTQIELIEIFLDGFTGQHRLIWHWVEGTMFAGLYTFVISSIEVLSLLALIATFIFLARRNLLKVPRFHKPEMAGWPTLDGNIILYLEILLVTAIFTMNSTDLALQAKGVYHQTDAFAISQFIAPMWAGLSEGTLIFLERAGWWLHFLVVLGFLNYLPISKHLHIMLAFPNTYYAKLQSRGEMDNMPEIMNEVKGMMGLTEDTGEMSMEDELPEFGTKDIFGLSWKNIMDAYTCTECGRCTSNCPANMTGKKLSPRKILMDIRDRTEEVAKNLDANNTECIREDMKATATTLTKENYDDGKSLFDYISREELHACTTCNACVEACPVMINPLEPILKMRRYEILTESAGPSDWVPMFTSVENSGSVWQIPDDRDKWVEQM